VVVARRNAVIVGASIWDKAKALKAEGHHRLSETPWLRFILPVPAIPRDRVEKLT
jgi:hypothetical protein